MTDQKKSLQELYPGRLDIPLLILLAGVLLGIGLILPVLTVQKIWEKNTFSVISGIQNLYQEKHYFLVFIIFFFSVIFPVIKLCSLGVLWVVRLKEEHQKSILYWLELLGKWSMLDVFVVAVIVVAVKLGVLAKAEPRTGIYIFGAAVLISMIVTFLVDNLAKRPKRSAR